MIGTSTRSWRSIPLWAVAALAAGCGLSWGSVEITGTVQLYNPLTSRYEPLKQVRVRFVLGEFCDSDTQDVEFMTNDQGLFRGGVVNAWFRSGYNVTLVVYAEVSYKLEIQDSWLQCDGYQVHTGEFWAADDSTTRRDLFIGGTRENVAWFKVGGVACLDGLPGLSPSAVPPEQCRRAFFLCHEMTDHRLCLQSLGRHFAVPPRPLRTLWEEKEVSFPLGVSVANYMPVDYIRYPDR